MRVFGVALVLISAGVVSAGCGDAIANTARRESKQFLGDGHPRILRIEKVQDVGGTREAVVAVQGHFKPTGGCGLGPCRPGSPIHYAWLDFSLSNPKDLSGFQMTSASQLAAVDHAKSARSALGIFPDFTNPAIRCAIPRGNASGTIAGACVTLFSTGSIGPHAHVRWIKFRERWPFVSTRDGHWPRGEKTGGWIVTLDRNERVQSIRVFGDLPPQLWK